MEQKVEVKSKKIYHKVRSEELSLFCYQMSVIIKSGISMVEGIGMIGEEMSDKYLISALKEMEKDLEVGDTFYNSVAKQDVFPTYMKAMIRIGETTGSLDEIMVYLSNYFERNAKLTQKIKSAITYPLILLCLMTAIILFLVVKVLPMFDEILNSVGGEMPGVTRAMLNISRGIRSYGLIIIIVIVLIIIGLYVFGKLPKGKSWFDMLKVKLPFFKAINNKIYTARFSMVMSILIKSGVDHDEALDMVVEVVGNEYIAQRVKNCKELILEGSDMKSAYMKTGIFSSLFAKMISIGYKTGEMDSMMAKISSISENEAETALARATSVIEPLLVIILSLVVGAILLTVMLPLINIMSSIG